MSESSAAARAWVDVWQRAWTIGDAELLTPVYADDAVHYSLPFRERGRPQDYVAWVFGEQAEAECRFGEPIVHADRAAVDWWGVITGKDGSVETVAGTSLLRFGADGRVVEQRDAWAAEPGRNELLDWAP